MWEAINNFLVAVDNKVWGVPLMVLIIAGGVDSSTSRLGFLQVRRLPLALKWMFKNEEKEARRRNLQFCSFMYSTECNNRYR